MIKKSNLDVRNRKKIDKLLKIINKSVYDYNYDIKEFTEELESNILIEVNDLMSSGITEEVAVETVINKIGKKDFSCDLIKVFNKSCFNWILNISFITSIIASILLLINIFCMIYIYIDRSESSFIYMNYFYNELFRYNFRLFLILYAASIIMFFIWSLINSLLLKRSRSFFFKVLPINIIGIVDLFLLVLYLYGGVNSNFITLVGIIVEISLITIPFWGYFIVKKTLMHY